MKKAIFTLSIILGLAMASHAQLELKGGGGLNWTNLTSDGVDWKSEGRIGYQFGAGALIGKKFYVEPSVYWARTSKDIISLSGENETANLTTVNSIRIPVLAGYHIIGGDEEKFVSLRVFAGPAGTFVTGVSSEADGLTKDDFNNFLFDIDAGLGIDFWFVFIDAHYMFGLSNVMKEGSDGKLRGFVGNVGFRIPL